MGSFAVGDVVTLPFPYADLTVFKKRPALLIGLADFDNLILCQITSKNNGSVKAIRLDSADFATGELNLNNFIRPDKLFTVEKSIIERKVGTLNSDKINTVLSQVRNLFS